MIGTKKLYSEFTSLKEDGSLEIIENKKLDVLTLVITENGKALKIRFDLEIKGEDAEERLSYVDNLRRKANLFGRASLEIKNYLKRNTYKELFESGDIDEELYDKKLGNFVNRKNNL